MATEFICKVGTAGQPNRDFVDLTSWTATCHCNLATTATKVYNSTKHSGTRFGVQDQQPVHLYRSGVEMDCSAWFLHATETQCLVRDIRGSAIPQVGDEWRQVSGGTYGWVTIQDAGDSAIAVAECYNDNEMRDSANLVGWGTSSVNYLKICTPTSERHTGIADTGFRIYSRNIESLLTLNDVDILVQGIEFKGGGKQISGTYRYGIHTIRIDSCIFHDNNWDDLIDVPNDAYLTTMIWNCALYNSHGNAIGYGGGSIHVENCSIYNPGRMGVYRAECYNVVAHRGHNFVDECFGDECTGDYNCDGLEVGTDGSAPGAHSLHNQTLEDISYVYVPQPKPTIPEEEIDLRTHTDQYTTSVLVGAGVDRSSGIIGFNTDIEGDSRVGLWTMGIDQVMYSSSSSSASSSSSSSATSSCSSSSSSASTFWLKMRDMTYDI